MRHPAIRFVLVFFVALFVGTYAAPAAFADARSEAKAHYQAGVKAYGTGDYRAAIREFSAAQQLAPADLNNYNLALCYDKLGEAEPAIQYYKQFLAKVPNADKRVEIEASIARLEGALQSAAAKRADEQRRAEEARAADEQKRQAARKAEQARLDEEMRKAAEAKQAEEGKRGATAEPGSDGSTGAGDTSGTSGARSVGTSGSPSTGQIISTGDAQLDRAAAIDINAIRQQRAGVGTTAGPAGAGTQPANGQGAMGVGGAGAQAGVATQAGPNGALPGQDAQASTSGSRGAEPTPPTDQPKAPTPVYKKWWFWAVVAVSVFVVYQIATTDSEPTTRARQALDVTSPRPLLPALDAGGATLLRF